VLARGACTVFAPSAEAGIDLGFAEAGGAPEHSVAVGTFRVMLPAEE
jgi:hypothetical protein